ncbi:MAG TPA: sigma-70 family RNA polymerase sigma factor [Cryptosporangiaceae bacterium]|nr:sigma-70 family RNA polymerase sigma factor [Cryptosporangiaceae bacterium]
MDDGEQVLRALHDEHADALWAYALRLTGGERARAEDLVQETLLRAWRQTDTLDPARGSVRAWLFTTARHLAIDTWRRPASRLEVVTDTVPDNRGVDEADRLLQSWLVAEALSRLSAEHRTVLLECFYAGRSVAEVAERLGIPPGTVKSRTHYALRALKLVFEESGVTA